MKRGFLLGAEDRKAAVKRRGAQKQTEPLAPSTFASEPPQNPNGFNVDNQGNLSVKAPYNNQIKEGKALPSDYNLDKSRYQFVYARSVTAIPQAVPDDETQCQWVVNGSTKEKVLSAPGYPAPIPKPCRPDLYHVRSTPDMGVGLFAKCNIKRGEVFLVERPLLVSPNTVKASSKNLFLHHYTPQQIEHIIMLEFESFLEYAFNRLPIESQADFKALHNAHTADGNCPLLGIMWSNGYGIGNLYDGSDGVGRYGAVSKIGSRINHSCIPNVGYYFKINSFSMQFYALRDIKAEEQFFSSYCSVDDTVAQRQARLAPYGFVCKCPACVNATPATDKLRTTFGSQIKLISQMVVENSSGISKATLEDAVRLVQNMVREGLDVADSKFVELLAAISLTYQKLGKLKGSEEYCVLMKASQKSFKDDE